MGYNIKDLEQQALKAIEEEDLVFIDELCCYLPCTPSTFYNNQMEKMESIRHALNKNKVKVKKNLRRKWEENDNATSQIALYKILGTEAEKDALNGSQKANVEGDIKVTVTRAVIKDEQS